MSMFANYNAFIISVFSSFKVNFEILCTWNASRVYHPVCRFLKIIPGLVEVKLKLSGTTCFSLTNNHQLVVIIYI